MKDGVEATVSSEAAAAAAAAMTDMKTNALLRDIIGLLPNCRVVVAVQEAQRLLIVLLFMRCLNLNQFMLLNIGFGERESNFNGLPKEKNNGLPKKKAWAWAVSSQ